jgi:ABC-2 type transport system permease protein
MRERFVKYRFIWQLGVQNALVYRTNFLLRAIFNLIPLLAIITLWRAIYGGKDASIAGYTLPQMVSYYLLVTVIDALTSVTEDDWQIAADIKEGHISQFLIRPMEYLGYRLCLFLSGRLVFTVASAAPVVVFLVMQQDYFLWPPGLGAFFCFALSLLFSALIQFFLSFALATLAFWVLEISSFVFVLLAAQRLLGGQMFPIDVLPTPLAHALLFTPFPCQTFFPASIYLGRLSGQALAAGLFVQFVWMIAAWLLARFCWTRGLRTYTAFGG